MAYRQNYRRSSSHRGQTTHGKKFRTKAGKYGSYKYVNGKRVGFVQHGSSRRSSKRSSSFRRQY